MSRLLLSSNNIQGGRGAPGHDFNLREKPPTSAELALALGPWYNFCIDDFGCSRCACRAHTPGPGSALSFMAEMTGNCPSCTALTIACLLTRHVRKQLPPGQSVDELHGAVELLQADRGRPWLQRGRDGSAVWQHSQACVPAGGVQAVKHPGQSMLPFVLVFDHLLSGFDRRRSAATVYLCFGGQGSGCCQLCRAAHCLQSGEPLTTHLYLFMMYAATALASQELTETPLRFRRGVSSLILRFRPQDLPHLRTLTHDY
jgi:hypothetical protein